MTSSIYFTRIHAARPLRWMGALALMMGAAACGGGGDSADLGASAGPTTPAAPKATALSGTAAVGAPISAGTVEVRCEGSTTVLRTVTAATGAWQIDTTGQALPCALRVTGGSLPAGQAYHSVAMAFGNTNITPLTDLMVANAVGKVPAAWWGSEGPAQLATLGQASLDKGLTALRAALGLDALKGVDPRTAQFTAMPKDKIDDVLEALGLGLKQSGMDYAGLLSTAASQNFVLPENFRVVLANSYVTITMGGSGSGSGSGSVDVPGTGGNYTLTLDVTASGMVLPPVTITNVPKPPSQAEFCGWVNDPASNLSLNQFSNGATGGITITGCSFSGNVGQVSATMTITSPVSMTVPYNVIYTYR